ncbi:MAG: tetraacyldisaccharide 4'-kinase [Paludibacteraceae bacterium]
MRTLLAPFSWLYGLGLAIRHTLYDNRLLPSHEVKVPTICVGNLAVGGTGKTPHVEYLIRLLAPRYTVAVLSRGYKRKTRGFVLADGRATASTIGDEAMQIHGKFPRVAVAACEDRVRGVKELLKRVEGLQVVILDDAFQHRAIRCGYYILLTPYNQLYIHDHLLPWGRLRDLKTRALKANTVIVTQCPPDAQPIDFRVIDNQLHLPTYQHLFFSQVHYAEGDIREGRRVLVLTGIAQPEYLMAYIRKRYPDARLMAFPDHHRFSKKDVARILSEAQQYDTVLTTEKDYQRLAETPIPEQLGNRLQPLPIEVQLRGDKNKDFDREILNYVKQNL